MEKNKKNVGLIIFLILIIIISFILLYFNNKEEEYEYELGEDISLKHYEENEYIPVNISYDQIARIYLQDYVYKLLYNREDAYNYLDEEYRKVKFPTYEEFDSYIDGIMSLKLREMTVVDYAITESGEYRYFDVHDSSDNLFIFKEKGVMQYTVLFDRYTIDF